MTNNTIIILIIYFAIQFLMFIGLCIYDAYAYINIGNEATITHVLRDFIKGWPIFTIIFSIIFGILIGHIAWGVKDNNPIVKLGIIKQKSNQ